MRVQIIACKVLESLIERQPSANGLTSIYLDYGLHRTPKKMSPAIQDEIDRLTEPATILLGYGLCGNGLVGVQARHHTLVIPKADDCITILLGSYERYVREFEAEPGTYYLTKGWLESGSTPLKEYRNLLEKYDPETADYVIDTQYRHYRRLCLVAPDEAELEAYRSQARLVADFCTTRWGFAYDERVGSEELIQRWLASVPRPRGSEEAFVIVPPGAHVTADMFGHSETT